MLRIGQIPYLNCEPYFAHLEDVELIPLTPKALGQAMAAETLDAAPLSLMDALRLEDRLAPLPFGIASAGPVKSVLLFADRAPAELDGAIIAVTDETATSVELLRVLLALRHEVTPRAWVGPREPADAVLLIGDAAIRESKTGRPWKHVLDIAGDWHEWTGLPCVFARWSMRAALPAATRVGFEQALGVALARGMASVPSIAARRRDPGFDPDEVAAYLRNFIYRFGPDEDRAIAHFRRLRASLDA